MAAMYFFSGIAKISEELWINGTAVNFILRNDVFNRFNMDWITAIPVIVYSLTWLCLFFQLSFPFLVWFERFRKPLLLAGLLMHVGIFIFLEVGWFSLVMFTAYAAFLKHEEIEAAINVIKKGLKKLKKILPKKAVS